MKNPFAYLKKVRTKMKDPYWRAKCKYIEYYDTLPIQEKWILLESQHGKEFNGNIYQTLKYLATSPKYEEYHIFLAAFGGDRAKKYRKRIKDLNITNVTVTVLASDKYFQVLASAKYLINDNTFTSFFVKKPGQVYINTWHGTPLKTLGKSNISDVVILGNAQKNFVDSDYLLFPNEYTRKHMLEDYMLENISSGKTFLCGYPRNTVFFDNSIKEEVAEIYNPEGKRLYAYMPTYRGTLDNIGSQKNNAYLLFYLFELDKNLDDNEILYVNLHPVAQKNISFKMFKHIRAFPENCETYTFLTITDALITDYSSVFFDYANTRNKIVLFPYDKEDYLKDRGMYLDMDDLPFPQAFDVQTLLNELRSEKNYDDTDFINTYCKYDNIDASQQLCDMAILGMDTGLEVEKIPDNGKENVFVYGGNLAQNGITTSMRSLLNTLDTDKRNYYISFCQGKAKNYAYQLTTFNPDVSFFAIAEYGHRNLTVKDRVTRKLFSKKLISAKTYMKKLGKREEQEFKRAYGSARIDTAIHFSGYESDIILMYSAFKGKKAIFVHNDMINEIKTRNNQRKDILEYAYNTYDKVVAVTEDIIPPTQKISGQDDNIIIAHNTIDYKSVIERAELPIMLDATTKCSIARQDFEEIINSDVPKFINVARFSPEKGHDRLVEAFDKLLKECDDDAYLIIMGGNSFGKCYDKLKAKVKEMGLEDKIILLQGVSNPFPIVKACDGFILSSFYEGFGLVLAEADILGKPIVSTDIVGPQLFMKKYGGTLIENSDEGVYNGLKMLYNGEIKPLGVDYEAYNDECVREFERIFSE